MQNVWFLKESNISNTIIKHIISVTLVCLTQSDTESSQSGTGTSRSLEFSYSRNHSVYYSWSPFPPLISCWNHHTISLLNLHVFPLPPFSSTVCFDLLFSFLSFLLPFHCSHCRHFWLLAAITALSPYPVSFHLHVSTPHPPLPVVSVLISSSSYPLLLLSFSLSTAPWWRIWVVLL